MAVRGKQTFQKRQKETARKDKQQRKAARRAQKKLEGANSSGRVLDDTELSTGVDREGEPPEMW